MTDPQVQVHDALFVRARIPAALERSFRLTLGQVYAPFFTEREVDVLDVVLREDEWARVADRFVSAQVERGFRLVSINPPSQDDRFIERLTSALAAGQIPGSPLPTFHHFHLLIRPEQLDECLTALDRLIAGAK